MAKPKKTTVIQDTDLSDMHAEAVAEYLMAHRIAENTATRLATLKAPVMAALKAHSGLILHDGRVIKLKRRTNWKHSGPVIGLQAQLAALMKDRQKAGDAIKTITEYPEVEKLPGQPVAKAAKAPGLLSRLLKQ